MMQLKNQVEWALHCCSVLAAVPEGKAVPAKVLAEFHGVPREYLAKAMQGLAQAGIVSGTLGPTGGYRMAKDPSDVSFLDIVEAVEGKKSTFACSEIRMKNPCMTKQERKCVGERPCGIAKVMWEADEAWREHLRGVLLSDLVARVGEEVPAEVLVKGAAWLMDRC